MEVLHFKYQGRIEYNSILLMELLVKIVTTLLDFLNKKSL